MSDQNPGTLDPSLLAEIAAGLGAAAALDDRLPAGTGRRWTYLIEADDYEALIIAWPPGTGLRMHDHGGSLAALHVVSGRLRERFTTSSNATRARWLETGDTLELPADHVHEVINLDDSEAISIHVYSPRLCDNEFRTDAEISLARTSSR